METLARRAAASLWVTLLLVGLTGCADDPADRAGASSADGSESSTTTSLISEGLAAIAAGDEEGARSAFESVLELDPPNVYAHYNLGYLAQLAGDTETALEEYTAALETDDAFAPALYNLAILTEEADMEAAIALYRREIAAAPDDAAGHYRLGSALIGVGESKEGRQMLRRAYKLDPTLRR